MIKNIKNKDLVLFKYSMDKDFTEGKIIYNSDNDDLFYILGNNNHFEGSYPRYIRDNNYKYSWCFVAFEFDSGGLILKKLDMSVEYYNERCHRYDSNK